MLNETRLISVSCDMAACDNHIACGADEDYATRQGWHRDVPIMDGHKDLCPDCYKDLVEFVGEMTTKCMACGASSATVHISHGVCDDCASGESPDDPEYGPADADDAREMSM